MKKIIKKKYRILSDFMKVHKFLTNIYDLQTLNSYMLPQFFEYAHTHSYFNYKQSHRMCIWEEEARIVGTVCYEMEIGEAYLVTDNEHTYLLDEMLEYAQKELSIIENRKRTLYVWVTDKEKDKIKLLSKKGYEKKENQPVRIFSFEKEFINLELPEEYEMFSLEDENNLKEIDKCLYRGFNHGDKPDYDVDDRLVMQSGPNFRKDLTTVIKDSNAEYVCYAGMWFDKKNKYAYLEPLCTVPNHRKKGLATIALTESMKKAKKLGATYCYGGEPEFYTTMGFETICNRELWKKEW